MASPSLDRRLGLTGNKAYKAPCDVATTTNITLSGEQTIDGVVTSGSRVLVWSQTNAVDNGIWDSSTGSWSRAIDCNTNQDLAKGTQVYVSGGSIYAGYRFVFTSSNPIQPGTSSITITQSTDSSTLQARLADPTSASNGAGMVGFTYALSYASGTVGRWMKDLATSAGAGLIGYLLNATGSVLRTLSLKLSERPSVLDFGAVADGNLSTGAGTDNSSAFQSAIDWANTNSSAIYIPAGKYVLRSQVTVPSNVRLYGAGMYRTFLIAPTAFTGNGLLWSTGAGGPPTIIEHMAILGQTSTGAGAGSTGIRASSNATLLNHLWTGGFLTQIRLDGTDCHATDCWADVGLSSGVGFAIENIGVSMHQCVTFNCYTGILINHTGAGPIAEPDGGVLIQGCEIIQSGFSGISMVSPQNVTVSAVKMHSPTATNKFTRDFVTIDGGGIVTLSDVQCTFGSATSTSCVGIRQIGETWRLIVKGCTMTGADYGYSFGSAMFSLVSGNIAGGCRTWGFSVNGQSAALVLNGNQSMYNGTSSGTDGGGYYLKNTSGSGKWAVVGNSAVDGGSQSKYGFYVDADASASAKINLGLNVVTNTATAYTLTGTTANITQTANI